MSTTLMSINEFLFAMSKETNCKSMFLQKYTQIKNKIKKSFKSKSKK